MKEKSKMEQFKDIKLILKMKIINDKKNKKILKRKKSLRKG